MSNRHMSIIEVEIQKEKIAQKKRKREDLDFLLMKRPTTVDDLRSRVPKLKDPMPSNAFPYWKDRGFDAKFPVLPASASAGGFPLSRGELGQNIFVTVPKQGFDTRDPRIHETPTNYQSLLDPNLKEYFRCNPAVCKRLLQLGLVNNEGHVISTLADFNKYRKYLGRLQNGQVTMEQRKLDEWMRTDFETVKHLARHIENTMRHELEKQRNLRMAFKRAEAEKLNRQRKLRALEHPSNYIQAKRSIEARLRKAKQDALRNNVSERLKRLRDAERRRQRHILLEWICKDEFREKLRKIIKLEKELNRQESINEFIATKRTFHENKRRYHNALFLRQKLETKCKLEAKYKAELGRHENRERKATEHTIRTQERQDRSLYLMKKYGYRWLYLTHKGKKNPYLSTWNIRNVLFSIIQQVRKASDTSNISNYWDFLHEIIKAEVGVSPETKEAVNSILDTLVERSYKEYIRRATTCLVDYVVDETRKEVYTHICEQGLDPKDLEKPIVPSRNRNFIYLPRPTFPCSGPCAEFGPGRADWPCNCVHDLEWLHGQLCGKLIKKLTSGIMKPTIIAQCDGIENLENNAKNAPKNPLVRRAVRHSTELVLNRGDPNKPFHPSHHQKKKVDKISRKLTDVLLAAGNAHKPTLARPRRPKTTEPDDEPYKRVFKHHTYRDDPKEDPLQSPRNLSNESDGPNEVKVKEIKQPTTPEKKHGRVFPQLQSSGPNYVLGEPNEENIRPASRSTSEDRPSERKESGNQDRPTPEEHVNWAKSRPSLVIEGVIPDDEFPVSLHASLGTKPSSALNTSNTPSSTSNRSGHYSIRGEPNLKGISGTSQGTEQNANGTRATKGSTGSDGNPHPSGVPDSKSYGNQGTDNKNAVGLLNDGQNQAPPPRETNSPDPLGKGQRISPQSVGGHTAFNTTEINGDSLRRSADGQNLTENPKVGHDLIDKQASGKGRSDPPEDIKTPTEERGRPDGRKGSSDKGVDRQMVADGPGEETSSSKGSGLLGIIPSDKPGSGQDGNDGREEGKVHSARSADQKGGQGVTDVTDGGPREGGQGVADEREGGKWRFSDLAEGNSGTSGPSGAPTLASGPSVTGEPSAGQSAESIPEGKHSVPGEPRGTQTVPDGPSGGQSVASGPSSGQTVTNGPSSGQSVTGGSSGGQTVASGPIGGQTLIDRSSSGQSVASVPSGGPSEPGGPSGGSAMVGGTSSGQSMASGPIGGKTVTVEPSSLQSVASGTSGGQSVTSGPNGPTGGQNVTIGPNGGQSMASGVQNVTGEPVRVQSVASGPSDGPSGGQAVVGGAISGQNMASGPSGGQAVTGELGSGQSVASGPSGGPSVAIGPSGGPSVASGPSGGPSVASGVQNVTGEPVRVQSVASGPSDGPSGGQAVVGGAISGQNMASGPSGGQAVTGELGSGQSVASGPSGGPSVAIGPSGGPSVAIGPSGGPSVAIGPSGGPSVASGPSGGPSVASGVQNVTGEPVRVQSVASGPSDGPSGGQAVVGGAISGQNMASGPSGGQAVTGELGSGQSVAGGPSGGPSVPGGPSGGQAVAGGPMYGQTMSSGSSGGQSVASGPSGVQPVAGGPSTGQSVASGPSGVQPVAGGPSTGQSVASGPSDVQPVASGPSTGQGVASGPNGIQPVASGPSTGQSMASGPNGVKMLPDGREVGTDSSNSQSEQKGISIERKGGKGVTDGPGSRKSVTYSLADGKAKSARPGDGNVLSNKPAGGKGITDEGILKQSQGAGPVGEYGSTDRPVDGKVPLDGGVGGQGSSDRPEGGTGSSDERKAGQVETDERGGGQVTTKRGRSGQGAEAGRRDEQGPFETPGGGQGSSDERSDGQGVSYEPGGEKVDSSGTGVRGGVPDGGQGGGFTPDLAVIPSIQTTSQKDADTATTLTTPISKDVEDQTWNLAAATEGTTGDPETRPTSSDNYYPQDGNQPQVQVGVTGRMTRAGKPDSSDTRVGTTLTLTLKDKQDGRAEGDSYRQDGVGQSTDGARIQSDNVSQKMWVERGAGRDERCNRAVEMEPCGCNPICPPDPWDNTTVFEGDLTRVASTNVNEILNSTRQILTEQHFEQQASLVVDRLLSQIGDRCQDSSDTSLSRTASGFVNLILSEQKEKLCQELAAAGSGDERALGRPTSPDAVQQCVREKLNHIRAILDELKSEMAEVGCRPENTSTTKIATKEQQQQHEPETGTSGRT